MAKPIEHGTVNAVATTGFKAGLGAIIVGAAALALPVLVFGGTVAATVGLFAYSHAIAAVAVGALGLAATGVAATVAGVAPWLAAGGGLLGAYSGASKVRAENAAYQGKVDSVTESRMHKRETQVNDANFSGMQQGYGMGFQEGQQYVINQLRAAQEQMMMQQMAAGHGKKVFATKLAEQRGAQAAAGPQMNVG